MIKKICVYNILFMESNKTELFDLSDAELYIKGSDETNLNVNILKNLSWVDSVEKELSSSLDNKAFLCSSTDELKEEEIETPQIIKSSKHLINVEEDEEDNTSLEISPISVDEINNIMALKFSKLTELEILQYQNLVIGIMRSIVKNDKQINLQDFKKKINWLMDGSKYMSNKLGLILFQHKCTQSQVQTIPRSSYQFCNFNCECEFNYNTKKKLGCYGQHYVHNLIYADLCALRNYITNHDDPEEIRKSINTISYVINHMCEELQNANKFNYFNNKNNHIERNPKKNKHNKQSTH